MVPSGQVWGGSPAKYIREATPEETGNIRKTAEHYANLASKHYEEIKKSEATREMERITAQLAPKNPYPEDNVETLPRNPKTQPKQ